MLRLSTALKSATQHAMPAEFGRKWGMECLNTRFSLPTLLCAEYSDITLNDNKININDLKSLLSNQYYITNMYYYIVENGAKYEVF